MEKEIYNHESYGQIGFSRITGNQRFYGSDLEQDHYIELKVYNSEWSRELSRDWYHAIRPAILSLRMTSGAFSEMITSMNSGDGVPCTIQSFSGKQMEKLPVHENRKEFVHRKFKDRMKEFAEKLTEKQALAKQLVKKKSLSKEDQRDLINHIEWLSQEIAANIPFFAECFQETIDKVVFEAKTEVENAIQHKISVLGMEALKNQNNILDK